MNVASIKGRLRRHFGDLRRSLKPKKFFCVLCERAVSEFIPFREGKRPPAVISQMQIVGGGWHNHACPNCLGHDRERHLLLYLRDAGILPLFAGARILHFAPESRLTGIIARQGPAEYPKGDLFPASPDVTPMNIQAIPFPDASFDFVIANHVLEHVEDDSIALGEIARVLKIGGHAILQTPYSAVLDRTFQDDKPGDDESRLRLYGQEDHLRLYGKDIFDRITGAGLRSRVMFHNNVLKDCDAGKMGVDRREPFFLFERP